MRIWDVTGPDVEAADAEPWDGPMASTMRPFATSAMVRLLISAVVLYLGAGVSICLIFLTARSTVPHPALLLTLAIWLMSVGGAALPILTAVSPRTMRRLFPAVGFWAIFLSTPSATWALVAGGPDLAVVIAAYGQAPLFAFYMLHRGWAVLCTLLVLIEFALVVGLQGGWAAPLGQWAFVLASVVATAVLMGPIAERSDRLAKSEHEARVELADVNATLESRVAEQVTEIERLGQLRRFLSPQVADAVMSGESEALARPHRQQIAVFFCDLRGFTAFTNGTEPEEVVGVLDEYYRAVGEVLQRYDATIGGYAGDGIMAYFGDPVVREDPAHDAVRMASELREPMNALVAAWTRRGYDLSYGIGVAYGYATLGVIGFDGRYDYTPLGAVVNLAARLCGQASAAQILLDHATHAATSDRLASEHHADLDLKGYGKATRSYALT
jgi:class 3 adenylate cyclase